MIPSGGKHRWKKVASQKHISHVFFRKFPGTMEVRKNGVRLRKNGAKLQNIGKFWKEQTTPKALFLFPFLNKRVSFIKRTRLFKILLFIILQMVVLIATGALIRKKKVDDYRFFMKTQLKVLLKMVLIMSAKLKLKISKFVIVLIRR